MREKYNENFVNIKGPSGKSNVFLKYFKYIEALLTPSIEDYRTFAFEDMYVDHPLVNVMKNYKSQRVTDSLIYLTGFTGTGKTSLLKRTFGHYENTYIFENETLVIPYACDNMVGDVSVLKKRLATLFFAMQRVLCETYGVPTFEENLPDFFAYVKERRIHFDTNQNGWRTISPEALLDQLYADDELELAILAFKFAMRDPKTHVNNVVFIMDDIESVGKQSELLPIYLANKIAACLNNRSTGEKKKWCSTVVIGCRHFVFRIFNTKRTHNEDDDFLTLAQIDRTTMESFHYSVCFDMGEMDNIPSIQRIIEKRKKTIMTVMTEEDRSEFQEICTVVNSIIGYVGDLLLALNVNDYRLTFSTIKDIIYNRKWLQKAENVNGAFKIGSAEDSFFNNRASVLRALALGENEVYFGDENIVPNLLRNRPEGGDLWVLLALRFFILNQGKWSCSLERNSVVSAVRAIFDDCDDLNKEFESAIDFLILNRLLLRGQLQEQRDSVDLKDTDLSYIRFFYTSSAAMTLWDYLGDSSILFEMFIDDVWIEGPRRTDRNMKSRFIQFNLRSYNECIYYLNRLVDIEEQIRCTAKNRGTFDLYCKHFGKVLVTQQLFRGLKKSHSTYFRNVRNEDGVELKMKLDRLEEKIKQL